MKLLATNNHISEEIKILPFYLRAFITEIKVVLFFPNQVATRSHAANCSLWKENDVAPQLGENWNRWLSPSAAIHFQQKRTEQA